MLRSIYFSVCLILTILAGGTLVLGPVDIDYAFQDESVFGREAHRLGIRLIL